MTELKPGDINDDGLEVEQDGWITRLNDNRPIDDGNTTMIELMRKEVKA